jgi:hypothetical protein
MTTKINYIGSRRNAEEQGSIDVLLLLIQAEPLDYDRFPTGFVSLRADGSVLLFGNFLHLDHAFSIQTDDKALLARFHAAFERNHALNYFTDLPTDSGFPIDTTAAAA